MSRLKTFLVSILLLLSFSLLFISLDVGADELRIDFLDVGQGDAILITSPSKAQLLIDAGRDTDLLRSLGEVMRFGDRKVDVILSTHPDADHIGGFPRFLDRYEVDTIIGLNSESQTLLFESFQEKSEGIHKVDGRRGVLIDLGSGVFVQVLFPYEGMIIGGNDSSVAVKVIYKDVAVLLTGDAGVGVEKELILLEGSNLESQILKLGHHGSKTSSLEEFLNQVNPEVVVISAGKDNSYGHPHAEVLENLGDIPYLGTYEEGTITFLSDGKTFWRKK